MHAGDDRVRAYRRKELIAHADGDVEAFILMTGLADEIDADEIDAAIAEAVKGLPACGYSWAGIGSRLGITRRPLSNAGITPRAQPCHTTATAVSRGHPRSSTSAASSPGPHRPLGAWTAPPIIQAKDNHPAWPRPRARLSLDLWV